MANEKLIRASEARKAILDADPKLAYCIDNIKAVDAVEVPCRCKECKYWRHYDHLGCTEFVKVCTLAYYMIEENGYCLYGAKMDGGSEDG